ncbi:MAG: 4Fe-4S dicluster domain-containing protein [Magnetospiraceae bacterium]
MPSEASDRRDTAYLLPFARFQDLLDVLVAAGYGLIGPRVADGAIIYDEITKVEDLPLGVIDTQDGGRYRLEKAEGAFSGAAFAHVVGPHSWKRYLHPPRDLMWRARRSGHSFTIDPAPEAPPRRAFIGVRSCERHAIEIHDKVFDNGDFADPAYAARRAGAFILAVNCARAGGTCFCASMDTGPHHGDSGYDLLLTEIIDDAGHRFLVTVGSDSGGDILAALSLRPADADLHGAAEQQGRKTAASMGRTMIADAADVLARNPEHRRWREVADRCLNCANCTMVCPTCFCSSTEDVTSLDGDIAERWKVWDSCFTVGFSYIHGGSLRRDAASRYRQWITHKLSHWHDQFGSSGCTGCGRCITWCPVGIDITEEAAAIASDGRTKAASEQASGEA